MQEDDYKKIGTFMIYISLETQYVSNFWNEIIYLYMNAWSLSKKSHLG